jgi:tetratricopeptide (TPR) repeat protein
MDKRILNDEDCDESLVLYHQARDEMDAANYGKAIELFEQSNRLSPHFKTCLLLGDCLMRVQRVREAIIPLAAATTLNRQGIAPTLLAECFLGLNDPSSAWEYVQIARARQPHYKRAQDLEPIARRAYERREADWMAIKPGRRHLENLKRSQNHLVTSENDGCCRFDCVTDLSSRGRYRSGRARTSPLTDEGA